MKKLIIIPIIIVMIAGLCIGLVACNKASTQGLLANILNDHNKETFSYDVSNSLTGETGTYNVTIQEYAQGSNIADFGNATLSDVSKGILVTGALTIGTTEYKTGCYFNLISGSAYMVPAYSYRVQKENGQETFRLQGTYAGTTLNFDKAVNGVTSSGSVGVSSPYYDNNEFHQTLRTLTNLSTNFSFAFNVPLITSTEETAVKLTASCSAKEDITVPYKAEAINCYRLYISRSTEVAGTNQTLYYAADNITINGWNAKNVLVKIIEPFKVDGKQYEMQYSLRTVTIE